MRWGSNPVGRAKSNQAVTSLRQLSDFQYGTDLGHDCQKSRQFASHALLNGQAPDAHIAAPFLYFPIRPAMLIPGIHCLFATGKPGLIAAIRRFPPLF
jgi:hypothetical protein